MKLLRQFGIILAICFLGELLHRLLKISIPGNVIGMIILLASLSTKALKLSHIEDISNFLLEHLAFFFVPAAVGIITSLGVLRGNWLSILGIIIISTTLVIVVTGITVQLIRGGK